FPDLYIGGDMHHTGYGNYRGTTIINGGTFQSRTDFQARFGHIPTPGVVPLVELKTMKITENNFYAESQKS
ncbi:MAG: DNA polymerase II small subunit, partial [Candidatus Diapherotrites archaeon]|nr:DNA polymerase II small subunit [Candidatus Diapherotrites archaeon]